MKHNTHSNTRQQKFFHSFPTQNIEPKEREGGSKGSEYIGGSEIRHEVK